MGVLNASIPPPTFANATTVSTGKPTPVSKKPMAAVQTNSPDCNPTIGGKIIFPAPTNRAKVIKPNARMSLEVNRCAIRFVNISLLDG